MVARVRYGSQVHFRCTSCSHHHRSCNHVSAFMEWAEATETGSEVLLHDDSDDTHQTYTSVSQKKIPYPLPDRLKALHDQYESGLSFPDHLVPPYVPDRRCVHGNAFNGADPVASNWTACERPTIYKASVSITTSTRKVYYRPSCGECSCKQEYDGQDDLLFNLDNKHLFCYNFLFSYLHSMVEGKNPLVAFLRACERNHSIQSHTQPVRIKVLRQAWNAFARLLDIDPQQTYQCPLCGLEPHTVICDGTMIGFRKDFLPKLQQCTKQSQPTIPGSKHGDRILITSAKARALLLKYAATSKDRRPTARAKQLTTAEFRELCQLTDKDFPSLVAFLKSLTRHTGKRLSPPEYRQLFSELARCSPACGIFQTRENSHVFDILQRVLSGGENLFDSGSHTNLSTLQEYVPVLVQFLLAATKGGKERLSAVATQMVTHILDVCRAPYSKRPPLPSCYLPVEEDEFSYFPNVPPLSGKGKYAADSRLNTSAHSDSCRKASYGHPSLSPGIFTVFCPHGICYGFEVMLSCESPRHPFSIFRHRFHVAPQSHNL